MNILHLHDNAVKPSPCCGEHLAPALPCAEFRCDLLGGDAEAYRENCAAAADLLAKVFEIDLSADDVHRLVQARVDGIIRDLHEGDADTIADFVSSRTLLIVGRKEVDTAALAISSERASTVTRAERMAA